VRGFGVAARVLPLNAALALGAGLGWVAFHIARIRRDVVMTNLRQGIGGDDKALEAIGTRCYENLGRGLVEYLRFPLLTREFVQETVKAVGRESLDSALARGRGVMAVTGHFGDWELMGAAFSLMGYPVHLLVGEQHNQRVDDTMNAYRQVAGVGIIPMGVAMRRVLQTLRKNEIVALLSDQDAHEEGVFVDFLGKPASTPKGPAAFALKTGAAMLPAFIVREGKTGKHTVYFESAIYPDKTSTIYSLTKSYTDKLESYIKQYPDHWFWPHRRWKTKPNAG
jgi:KDO2-lipid IV(A) lauroyltransferase